MKKYLTYLAWNKNINIDYIDGSLLFDCFIDSIIDINIDFDVYWGQDV